MTDCTAAPVRRGSIVFRARRTWLVWNVAPATLEAFPIRRQPTPARITDIAIEHPADQLLARIKGAAAVRAGSPFTLRRSEVEYAGEFTAVCAVTHALIRGAAAAAQERRWADERTHRRRAFAEKSAL